MAARWVLSLSRRSSASPSPVPFVGICGTVAVANLPVGLVPVSGLIPRQNDVIGARGATAAGTGSVEAADSFRPLLLKWGAAFAAVLVSILVRVIGRMVFTGVILLRFDTFLPGVPPKGVWYSTYAR